MEESPIQPLRRKMRAAVLSISSESGSHKNEASGKISFLFPGRLPFKCKIN